MFFHGIHPAVFIKFDDKDAPVLFARQTVPTPDVCIMGPPCSYWTRILHFDSVAKAIQRIPLQRVRSDRLMQDSTFVVIGRGSFEQLVTTAPDQFSSLSRARRLFKETFSYFKSIPESDLYNMGWDSIGKDGILDPVKTFLPKVTGGDARSADDEVYINYMDMLITMVTHRLKNELVVRPQWSDGVEETESRDERYTPHRPRVIRTEHKFEIAGRNDRPGVYFVRNKNDFITDVCIMGMYDMNLDRSVHGETEGLYFYDIQAVNELLLKLRSVGYGAVRPEDREFYKYVLTADEDVRDAIACSAHTIGLGIDEVLRDNRLIDLYKFDPARIDPGQCVKDNIDRVRVTTCFSQYLTTYYIEKNRKILRVRGGFPNGLTPSDCVARVFKLKWRGFDDQTKKYVYTMFPQFCLVFKNMIVYEESEETEPKHDILEYAFPSENCYPPPTDGEFADEPSTQYRFEDFILPHGQEIFS